MVTLSSLFHMFLHIEEDVPLRVSLALGSGARARVDFASPARVNVVAHVDVLDTVCNPPIVRLFFAACHVFLDVPG